MFGINIYGDLMTKKYNKNQIELEKLRSNIEKYSNDFNESWNYHNVKKYELSTHSWFDLNVSVNRINTYNNDSQYDFKTEELKDVSYKCNKQIIMPNENQKSILLAWMDSYIKMYNATLKVLKQMQYDKQDMSFNFKTVRTHYMKDIKENILIESGNTKKTRIPSNTLDCAIKDVCTAFKSAFTNSRNGNIKHFVVRYIKQSKPQKIVKLEQSAFGKNKKTFCSSVFGKEIKTNDDNDFSDVKCGVTILYNSRNDRFTLLKPIKINNNVMSESKMYNYIGLDPGIRTFLTGYFSKYVIEICKNLKEKISKQLENIDIINNCPYLSDTKKKYAENKRYEKIKNLVDDLHWKTIKYLTDTYNTILIGNMSTKSIVKNKLVGDLDNMTKRVALMMRLFEFKERLKYKCSLNNCNYGQINEMYTSKTCSYCGNIKENLKGNKIYNCKKCHMIIDRDINGAKNILMKSIL